MLLLYAADPCSAVVLRELTAMYGPHPLLPAVRARHLGLHRRHREWLARGMQGVSRLRQHAAAPAHPPPSASLP